MATTTNLSPAEVAALISKGMTLFVPPIGQIQLLADPRIPQEFRSPLTGEDIDVDCQLDEILTAMGNHRDLPEHDEMESYVVNYQRLRSGICGWRDKGHTKEGRYIKFAV